MTAAQDGAILVASGIGKRFDALVVLDAVDGATKRSASSGRTAPARRRCSTCCRGR